VLQFICENLNQYLQSISHILMNCMYIYRSAICPTPFQIYHWICTYRFSGRFEKNMDGVGRELDMRRKNSIFHIYIYIYIYIYIFAINLMSVHNFVPGGLESCLFFLILYCKYRGGELHLCYICMMSDIFSR
jgi:hypothetical protein